MSLVIWLLCGPVSSANQTDRYNITEILLNVALNINNHITNDIFISFTWFLSYKLVYCKIIILEKFFIRQVVLSISQNERESNSPQHWWCLIDTGCIYRGRSRYHTIIFTVVTFWIVKDNDNNIPLTQLSCRK
jgi:hypothetical protein